MEKRKEWSVGGFQFSTERDMELAKEEQSKIAFMEKRMHYDQPESVLYIYNKAIENGIFQTPVGLQYMQKLYDFLTEHGLSERAESIPLRQVYSYDPRAEIKPRMAKKRVQPSKYKELRSKLRKSVILNILLVAVVIAMFIITLTGKNPNILNYEKKLTDKYAGWEQELTEREAVIREKERELRIEGHDSP